MLPERAPDYVPTEFPPPLATAGHSVRTPGVLSETVEKRYILVDEFEIESLELLGERLRSLGIGTPAVLIGRLVDRYKQGAPV